MTAEVPVAAATEARRRPRRRRGRGAGRGRVPGLRAGRVRRCSTGWTSTVAAGGVRLPGRRLRLRQVDAAQPDRRAAPSRRPGGSRSSAERPALMFQEPALLPWLTAAGNVELALRARGVGRARAAGGGRAGCCAWSTSTGQGGKRVHELSGGMRQRVALARALAQDSSVLLMDEPFAALDAITRDVLHQELTRVWAEQGLTVVFVTHNVREAARLGQRVVLWAPGPAGSSASGRSTSRSPARSSRPRSARSPPRSPASCTRRSAAMASDLQRPAHRPRSRASGDVENRAGRGRPRRPRRPRRSCRRGPAPGRRFVRSVLPPLVFLAAARRASGSWPTWPRSSRPYALPVAGRRRRRRSGRRCRTAGRPRRSGRA